MIKIGKLIHSIVIQKKIVSRNTMGAEVITWEDFTRAWASVEPLGGREYLLAQQMQAAIDHRSTMRYQSGITSDMRITWNDRIYDIKSILNTEMRNIELVIYCKEIEAKAVIGTVPYVIESVGLGEGALGEGPLGGGA